MEKKIFRNMPIITKDIVIIDQTNIMYNSIYFKEHPIYKGYFFNKNNIKIIIKKYDSFFISLNINLNKIEKKEIITVTTSEHRIVKTVSSLILETFNGLKSNKKDVCIHYDDNQLNNEINNLSWSSQNYNTKIFGINTELNKLIVLKICEKFKFLINELKIPEKYYLKNNQKIPKNKIFLFNNEQFLKISGFYKLYISIDGNKIYDDFNKKYLNITIHKSLVCKRYPRCVYHGKSYNVHYFMALTKYNEYKYDKNTCILHINDIKSDNSYNNIIIGSHALNMKDRSENYKELKQIRILLKQKFYNEYKLILEEIYNEFDDAYKKYFIYLPLEKLL